jgi:hypothetical protein
MVNPNAKNEQCLQPRWQQRSEAVFVGVAALNLIADPCLLSLPRGDPGPLRHPKARAGLVVTDSAALAVASIAKIEAS